MIIIVSSDDWLEKFATALSATAALVEKPFALIVTVPSAGAVQDHHSVRPVAPAGKNSPGSEFAPELSPVKLIVEPEIVVRCAKLSFVGWMRISTGRFVVNMPLTSVDCTVS